MGAGMRNAVRIMRTERREVQRSLKKIIAAGLLMAVFLDTAAVASDFRFSPRPNRASLIQWREWSQETLEEAEKQDRLIVLALSAVWCHWCHVMDETTYSDEVIIGLINEKFIPVRVDADMRPDIDSLYNQGGWPSTVILTPGGEVLDGGNYIPPGDMKERLDRAFSLYTKDRDKIAKRMEEIKLRRMLMQGSMTGAPDKTDIDGIVELLKSMFDDRNGGFGSGQKFPNPDAADFLLSVHAKSRDAELRKIVTRTLDRMAQGEVYDHIEGGFFRYATKPDWSEPHYEKMLEVNAGLIRSYANASLAFGMDRYRRVVRESLRYVQGNLYDATSGALFGSQDADESYYRKQHRRKLTKPFVDRTVYADSASLMISALITAGEATGEQQYLPMAVKAGEFMIKNLYRPADGLFHSFRGGKASLPGLLNDNALFGSALLDLYNATGERRYLDRAGRVSQVITNKFYDPKARRFRSSLVAAGVAPLTPGILAEMNDRMANYRAARFLGRLSNYTRDKNVKEIVGAALTTLSATYRNYTPQAPSYGIALQWNIGEPVEIMVLADGNRVREYLAAVNNVYVPEKVVRVLSLAEDREEIKSYGYKTQESVYLCAGRRCSKPIKDPGKVGDELRRFIAGPEEERNN
jgi:uncharacterized protein YyaL (SSP411 family)